MTQTNTSVPSGDQPKMTLVVMIRGVLVRVAVAAVFVVALMYASYAEVDRFPIPALAGEIRIFSLLGIITILRYFFVKWRIKTIGFHVVVAIMLLPFMVYRWDHVPYLDISFLSMLGIVLSQHPFSLALLRFYQWQAERTRKRIASKVAAIRAAGQ